LAVERTETECNAETRRSSYVDAYKAGGIKYVSRRSSKAYQLDDIDAGRASATGDEFRLGQCGANMTQDGQQPQPQIIRCRRPCVYVIAPPAYASCSYHKHVANPGSGHLSPDFPPYSSL